ncbi:hypothetical protein [Sandaracinus amylolyticus]|uniref:hypothetical protein n=1 Tax=Sandaracinus amylolyticus TaxID=927083 RepID=UPI001F1D01AC|nr:hypothetical protein [Sandaracinus amylolyticus]UJR82018.1 Hypothetical protein I5071_40830 [Sandaracinus amylolyticus]
MEAKLNVGILCTLALAWASLTLAEPSSAMDPHAELTRDLADMEDRFARDREDPALAEHLADAYLDLDRPDLAVATLSTADASVQADPAVAHRLARAYEQSGRVADALATAELAAARCARSIGTADSSSVTPIPERSCSERTYAALSMHRNALSRMHAWGVTDPRTDSRAQLAYSLSVRAARILSASR